VQGGRRVSVLRAQQARGGRADSKGGVRQTRQRRLRRGAVGGVRPEVVSRGLIALLPTAAPQAARESVAVEEETGQCRGAF